MTQETKNKISKALSIPMKERIMKHVQIDPETGCWNWTGALKGFGYGNIRANGRNYRAHRVSYEIHKGRIPYGKVIRHKCDNRRCINPDHLELGTQAENVRDCIERGRRHEQRIKKAVQYSLPVAVEDGMAEF